MENEAKNARRECKNQVAQAHYLENKDTINLKRKTLYQICHDMVSINDACSSNPSGLQAPIPHKMFPK